MFVLHALESGSYSGFGNAIVTTGSARMFSFEAMFNVQSTSVRFAATGTFQVTGPGFKHDFFFEVRPLDNTGVSFVYRDAFLPAIQGKGSWVKDCYLLSGECKHSGARLTCHLEPGENQTLSAKVLALFGETKRAAVQFTIAPHEPKIAMANIVSIHSRRRA